MENMGRNTNCLLVSNRTSGSFPNLPERDGKEEGELSQSDEDEIPCCLNDPVKLPPSAGTTSSNPQTQLMPGNGQGLNASVGSITLTAGTNPCSGKATTRYQAQAPSKLINTGKSVPSVVRKNRDNLVISFSEDDSDKDSMELKRPKLLSSVKQGHFTRPSHSSLPLHHQKPRSVTKSSKSAMVTRSVDSPSAKRSRGTISNKGSIRSKRFNSTDSTTIGQEQNIDMLQDLRQKIALREKQLKLKTMQLNKDYTSFSVRDMKNVQADANVTTENSVEKVLDEPEKKRLKRAAAISSLPSHDGNKLIAQNIAIVDNSTHTKNSKMGTFDSGNQNCGEANRFVEIPGNNFRVALKNVSEVNEAQKNKCSLATRREPAEFEERLPVVNHTAGNFVENMSSNDDRQQELGKSFVKTVREGSAIPSCSISLNEAIGKSIIPSVRTNEDTQFHGFDGYNQGKIGKFGNLEVEALNKMEECLENELEAAQELRHNCELEERNALKAYRKAQRALLLANAKCQEILRKRELFSSRWSSFLINDSSLLWTSQTMADTGANLSFQALDIMPSSQREGDRRNEADGDTNIICAQNAHPASPRLETKQNVEHESCSESDTSASEPHDNQNDDANGLSYDSSAEEDDETFEVDCEKNISQDRSHERKEQHSSRNHSSNDAAVDSLILEAQLRSKLFTRLRTRDASSNRESNNTLILSVDDENDQMATNNATVVTESLETGSHTFDVRSHMKFNETREKDVGFLTFSTLVDPFWPLCMFELRGKCNNQKCAWQHLKHRNSHAHNTTDYPVEHETVTLSKSHSCHRESSPLYVVALDSLKAERLPYDSAFVWRSGKFWQKCFSRCLCLSNTFHADFPADNAIVNGVDGRIEVHGSWKAQALQYRQLILNNLTKDSPSKVDSIEMALLSHRLDNGVAFFKKALSILARAVEADSQSEFLWIAYLLHYHSNAASPRKTDMFSHAVKHVDGSYVLWLMFINSRTVLEDRLAAYSSALATLCLKTRNLKDDKKFLSSCVLDLFLQYLSFQCVSGNVQEAINSAYSENTCIPLLSDVLSSITFSDQLVLWVCSVYMIIYRKLPVAILQRLECEKELLEIEWPSIYISPDETDRVVKMIDEALHSTQFFTRDIHSDQIEIVHQFAVTHVRCMAAIGCIDRSRKLIDLYSKKFPSCLDLILLSAKMRPTGFEEVLAKNFSGKDYIWHQYIEFSMQKEGRDLCLNLLIRWFSSLPSNTYCHSESSSIDVLFGHLNFAWLKILEGENGESLSAIDRAFKSGGQHDLKQFFRGLANILRDSSMKPEEILCVLKRYLDEAWACSSVESLSGKSVNSSICALVSPVSADHALLNTVLGVLNGPSLVPKSGDLVGYAECVMGILPWNYEFALCLCRYVRREGIVTTSVVYWGCLNLVDALFGAVPVAPEHVWVETASFIDDFDIGEIFFKRALSVFPFSFLLWRCFYHFRLRFGSAHSVALAAKQLGFSLS